MRSISAADLLTREWPIEYINFPDGKGHYDCSTLTLCGIDLLLKTGWGRSTERTQPLCKRCKKASKRS